MVKPILLPMVDGSTVALWPTGHATVARHAGGHFDQDREPCLAADFAARQRERTRFRHLLALAREATLRQWRPTLWVKVTPMATTITVPPTEPCHA